MPIPEARQITEYFGPDYREAVIGDVICLGRRAPLALDCGRPISDFPVAFRTYGTLSPARDNAVLLFHTLTADQYVCETHPVTGKPGWWDVAVGPGKAIDTDRFYVICANVLGGCMGTFGPKTLAEDGAPWGLRFPVVTPRDMAMMHVELLEWLGVETPFALVGPSMGGMVAMEFALLHPAKARRLILAGCGYRQNPQNIAFNEIGRQAVTADPDWQDGDYLRRRAFPEKGLSVGRMSAQLTFMSRAKIEEKFGRGLQNQSDGISFGFGADFKVESYLHYQGASFVKRFDPNSYLYLTRATDYYDLTRGGAVSLPAALAPLKGARLTAFTFSSDWRCPAEEVRPLVHASVAAGLDVSGTDFATDQGHDAFLMKDEPAFLNSLRGALA